MVTLNSLVDVSEGPEDAMKWSSDPEESFWFDVVFNSPLGVVLAIALVVFIYWILGFVPAS